MGLGESKVPFERDGRPKTPEIRKEIGISSMWDPRSPSQCFERTPIQAGIESNETRDENYIGCVNGDPRSPNSDIPRTPVRKDNDFNVIENDADVYSELRAQLERLQLRGDSTTSSTECLPNDSMNAVSQQKAVLELLQDDFPVGSPTDPSWSTSTPACTPSRSTALEVTPASPDVPELLDETDSLIKKRKPLSSRKHGNLQKKVLKKSFVGNQAARSPLAQCNNISVGNKDSVMIYTGKVKPSAFVKYRKYNNLDESFNDSFTGKENENIVWY